jgi:D-alanyl-D-alanine carboxypeptidase
MRIRSLLLAALLVPPAAQAQSRFLEQHPDVASRIELYSRWVEAQMRYDHQPGVSIGIVVGTDLVWAKGFGYADRERRIPATPTTAYRIASITKLFTATAIMQLRDAGKLRLDDPVAKHLPWFTIRSKFADAPPITIEQLLTHTSGLPRESTQPYWSDPQYFPTHDELVKALATQDAVYEPATRWKYSNLALSIAGEVVAAVSGEPWADYVERHILQPLGMRGTTPRPTPQMLAVGYQVLTEDGQQTVAPFTDTRAIAPAANMASTVEDLATFMAFQLSDDPSGDKILRRTTRREMHRVHWLRADWKSGWGIGFSVNRAGNRNLVGHGGWLDGYRTQIAFDPQAKVGVVVMTNTVEAGPGAYVAKAYEVIVPAIEAAQAPAPVKAVADPAWQKFLGRYFGSDGYITEVRVVDGKLVMYQPGLPPELDLAESVSELVPEGGTRFREAPTPDGGGEPVVFELGADGKVVRLKNGENYLFPVGCGRIADGVRCQPVR